MCFIIDIHITVLLAKIIINDIGFVKGRQFKLNNNHNTTSLKNKVTKFTSLEILLSSRSCGCELWDLFERI